MSTSKVISLEELASLLGEESFLLLDNLFGLDLLGLGLASSLSEEARHKYKVVLCCGGTPKGADRQLILKRLGVSDCTFYVKWRKPVHDLTDRFPVELIVELIRSKDTPTGHPKIRSTTKVTAKANAKDMPELHPLFEKLNHAIDYMLGGAQ